MTEHNTHHYKSWGDYLIDVDKPSVMANDQRVSRAIGGTEGGTDRGTWTGTKSYDHAMQLATNGWPEGADKARTKAQLLFDHISTAIERQDVVYDTEGHYIDVARFNDNEPECWGRFEAVKAEGAGRKLVRVLYNFGASCGVKSEVIMARGAAVLALVELMEFAGHRVEVVAGNQSRHYHKVPVEIETRILVKEFDQHLDVDRLAFVLVNPSMLRRLWMSQVEAAYGPRAKSLGIGVDGGYGSPEELRATQGEIYLGAANSTNVNWLEFKDACTWIVERLKEQGVELARAEGAT